MWIPCLFSQTHAGDAGPLATQMSRRQAAPNRANSALAIDKGLSPNNRVSLWAVVA